MYLILQRPIGLPLLRVLHGRRISLPEMLQRTELGMMPYISEDGSKNIYAYNPSQYFGISKRLTEPGNEKKLENYWK